LIRAVVFDVGDVVCSFVPERRLRQLARLTGLDADLIHAAIWTSGLDDRAEAGELSPADLEVLLLDALDGRIDADALRAAWSTAFTPDADVCAVVGRLERPAYAFTNNGPMLSACLSYELRALGQLFERVICSWQLKARKPDTAAFERLCAELHHRPEELLFVDDCARNCASARQVGLTAITFTSVEGLVDDLGRALAAS